MLKYVSFPVSMAKKLFYIIPYILGFMHEQQHIVIRMYDSFVDDSVSLPKQFGSQVYPKGFMLIIIVHL